MNWEFLSNLYHFKDAGFLTLSRFNCVRLQVFCFMNNDQKEQNRDYLLRFLLFLDVYSFIAVKIPV